MPFSKPSSSDFLDVKSWSYLRQVIDSGSLDGDGRVNQQVNEFKEDRTVSLRIEAYGLDSV